jgi:hypothetical protein
VIYAGTYSTVIATTNNFATGLVGTLGVRIIDSSGTNIIARRTTGITEPISGSGFYVAALDLTALSAQPAAGHYFVFWDNGSVSPGNNAAEDLILHQTTTLSNALRAVGNTVISHNAENISVGLFIA